MVQGAELGETYNLYGSGENDATLLAPSSISGWSENQLGSSNLSGNKNIPDKVTFNSLGNESI